MLGQTEVFISLSGDTDASWAMQLEGLISKHCGIPADRIYLYHGEDAGRGRTITPEIEKALQEAKVLLCIISDDFIESPWCIREQKDFVGENHNKLPFIIGVRRENLLRYPGITRQESDKLADQILPVITDNIQNHAGHASRRTELLSYVKTDWCDWLTEDRHIDLTNDRYVRLDFNDLSTDQNKRDFPEIIKLIDQVSKIRMAAEEKIVEQSELAKEAGLRRASAVAAFAIAADRFYEGGWGFSIADLFSHDDEDDDELTRGRYDFNILILRALKRFLPYEVLSEEFESAFVTLTDRQPKWRVIDRLPKIASYVSQYELKSIGGFKQRIIWRGKEIQENLTVPRPNTRYGVDPEANGDISSQVLLDFHFLCHSESFWTTEVDPNIRFDPKPIKQSIAALQDTVTIWLRENNIFQLIMNEDERDPQSVMRTSVMWCILAGQINGLGRIGSIVWDDLTRNDLHDEFANRVSTILDQAQTDPETHFDKFVLALSGIYVVSQLDRLGGLGRDPEFTRKLYTLVEEMFASKDGLRFLLKQNCISWALVIILSESIIADSQTGGLNSNTLDDEALYQLWASGRSLREKRVHALQSLPIDELRDGALRQIVVRHVEKLVERHELDFHAVSADRKEAIQLLGFDAAYWAKSLDLPEVSTFESERTIMGRLEVNADTLSFDYDSHGYGLLFLVPFSQITGMNLSSLQGARHEFGSDDKELVKTMGSVVVEECYPQKGGGQFDGRSIDFEKRTSRISDQLVRGAWNTSFGFSDLLKLRSCGDLKPTWVMRTGSLQHPPGTSTRNQSLEDSKILWQFMKIDASLAELLIKPEPGQIHDDRNSL